MYRLFQKFTKKCELFRHDFRLLMCLIVDVITRVRGRHVISVCAPSLCNDVCVRKVVTLVKYVCWDDVCV